MMKIQNVYLLRVAVSHFDLPAPMLRVGTGLGKQFQRLNPAHRHLLPPRGSASPLAGEYIAIKGGFER